LVVEKDDRHGAGGVHYADQHDAAEGRAAGGGPGKGGPESHRTGQGRDTHMEGSRTFQHQTEALMTWQEHKVRAYPFPFQTYRSLVVLERPERIARSPTQFEIAPIVTGFGYDFAKDFAAQMVQDGICL